MSLSEYLNQHFYGMDWAKLSVASVFGQRDDYKKLIMENIFGIKEPEIPDYSGK